MPPRTVIDPLDEIVLVECKGGSKLRIHRNLLIKNSLFLAKELLECKRQIASGIHVLRTGILAHRLQRYALRLYGSPNFQKFDSTLTAPELILELSALHSMAVKLQDENFGNDIIDAMTMHLIASSDELWLEKFLPEFLQSNGEGSMGRKLVVDWFVWSALVFDVKAESLLTRIQDLDFYGEVVVAILKKNEAEWESDAQPPYCKCLCCYHMHTENGGQLCGGVTKVEKMEV